MRILYFSFVELDIPNACQTHTLGILRGFSNNGCQVDALVPRPLKMRPVIPAVRFFYLWPWRFSNVGKLWIKLLSAFCMAFLCIKDYYDAIYVREMENNPGPRLLSKLFKIPLYIEINDLIVPTLIESGSSKKIVKKLRKHQELDFRQSSGLIIPSVPRREWIINQYNIHSDKVHLILNGADLQKNGMLDRIHAKRRLGLSPTAFCIGFLGTIYERYDFNTVLQAILKCQQQILELFLLIVGDGPSRPQIEKKISELGLETRTIFTGYIEPEKLGTIIPAFDLGLMTLNKKGVESAGPVHTKLSTYAMYGLPILAAGFSLQGYPKEISKGLYLVPPENPCAMAEKIFAIYNNTSDRKKKAKILYNFAVEKLTWSKVTKKILDVIRYDIASE